MGLLTDEKYVDLIGYNPVTEHDVRKIAQAQHIETLAKIREVVEGAKLPKFQHNHEIIVGTKEWHHKEGYNLGVQAQLQAILKAIEGD